MEKMEFDIGEEAVQSLIRDELADIVRLQILIQNELERLIEMSKAGGKLDIAFSQGEKSFETLAKAANISLDGKFIEKIKKISQNVTKNQ